MTTDDLRVTARAALTAWDDPACFADMTAAIDDGATIVAAGAPGVLVMTGDGTIQVVADGPHSATDLLDRLDAAGIPARLMVAHDPHSRAEAERRYGFDHQTVCLGSAWLGPRPPVPHLPGVRIAPLSDADHPVVAAHYAMEDPPYTSERIASGQMWGAFRDDQLLAFIGRHRQGAMGLLVVLPEHRRQGLAQLLVAALVNRLLDAGHLPYDHIIVGNQASEDLQRKLGFTISTRQLVWMSAFDR